MAKKVRVPTRSSRVHTKNFRKLGKNTGVSVPAKASTTNRHLKVTSNNPFKGSFE